MRLARTIAPLVGLVLAAALVSPAGAGVHAATNQAIFSAGLIGASDVPSSWTPSKQSDTGSKVYRSISACKQLANAIDGLRKGGPRKLSPTFTDDASPNRLTMAEDTVYAYKSTGAATKAVQTLKAAPALSCLAQVATKAAGPRSRAEVADISSELQGVGDDQAGYEVTLHATDQSGAQVTAILDIVGVRVGRAVIGFDFSNQDTRLPQAQAITNAVINRVANA
jgi:hypothetical protein